MIPINKTIKQAVVHHILGKVLEVSSQKQYKDAFMINSNQPILDTLKSLISQVKIIDCIKYKENVNIIFYKLCKYIWRKCSQMEVLTINGKK